MGVGRPAGPIPVKSEIDPLQKVFASPPGAELEYLVPDALERLLFDDIPYLHGAQQEHDRFVQLLRENGTEVVFPGGSDGGSHRNRRSLFGMHSLMPLFPARERWRSITGRS